MKISFKLILATICCFATFTACNEKKVVGSGNIITKEIPIDIYSEIQIEGAINNLEYEAKPSDPTYFRIETDDNIVPLVSVKNDGYKLEIKTLDKINATQLKIYTNSPSLKKLVSKGITNINLKGGIAGEQLTIELKGVGNVNAEKLIYDKTDFNIEGASDLIVAGQCNNAKINVKGSGNVNAENFVVNNLNCELNGVGNLTVNAVETLSIELKGSGNVAYKGNPQITKQEVKGVGSIKALQ